MKHLIVFTAILLSSTILSGCEGKDGSDTGGSPDLILTNGQIYTVNTEQPWAEAIAIDDGKIVFVGSTENAMKLAGKTTKTMDMAGKMVLPGFQDAHIHPMEGASLETFFGCRLEEHKRTVKKAEDWIPFLSKCKDKERPIEWVLGGGHDLVDLLNLDRMPKELLDEAMPDTPVAMMEKSSHSVWVNSIALELAGITKDTPNSQGGMVIKDPKTGEPNGILLDSAGDEVLHFALKATPKLQQARYEALLISQDLMAASGITSATNARVYWDRGNVDHWLRAEKEGTLKSRSIMAVWAYPHMDDDKQLAKLKSYYDNSRDSLLRWSQVKFYSDGTVSNNSAAVLEPYAFLIHPASKPLGLNYFTEDRMARYITELEKIGYDAHIHALGDRAVRETLNAIETAHKANPELIGKRRHQLTHIDLINKTDIPRFAELKAIPNFQINFEIEEHSGESGGDYWESIIANSTALITPVLEVDAAGSDIVLSSDWDVSYMEPLVSIELMATDFAGGRPKDELIALAIKAYTLNAAYALDHETMTGSIEVGKYADIVVLRDNIFQIPVKQIRKTPIVMTLLEGREVYRAKEY